MIILFLNMSKNKNKSWKYGYRARQKKYFFWFWGVHTDPPNLGSAQKSENLSTLGHYCTVNKTIRNFLLVTIQEPLTRPFQNTPYFSQSGNFSIVGECLKLYEQPVQQHPYLRSPYGTDLNIVSTPAQLQEGRGQNNPQKRPREPMASWWSHQP